MPADLAERTELAVACAHRPPPATVAPAAVAPGAVACEFRATSVWGVFDEVRPDSAYFWTREWQQGEREADEDIKAGRLISFDNADDAMEYLRNLANEDDA